MITAPLAQELWAGHDALDQRMKTIVGRGQIRHDFLDGDLVGQDQRPAQGIGEQFAAEVFDELRAPVFPKILPQAVQARSLNAVGKLGGGVHRPLPPVFFPSGTGRAIAFEHESEGIKAPMTGGAALVLAMPGQRLAET